MPGVEVSSSVAGLLHAIARETDDERVVELRNRVAEVLGGALVCDALAALAFVLAGIVTQKVPDDEQQTAILEAFPHLVQAMMLGKAED